MWIRCPNCREVYTSQYSNCPICKSANFSQHQKPPKKHREVPFFYDEDDEDAEDMELYDDIFDAHSKLSEGDFL